MNGRKDPWSWLGAGDRLRRQSGDDLPGERPPESPDVANVPPLTRRQLLTFIARDAVSGLGWGVALGFVGWVILGLSYGFAATFRPIDLAHPTGLVGCTGAPAFLSFLAIWHNLTGETSISIGASFFLAACLFVFVVMLVGLFLAVWIGSGGSFLVVTIACFTLVGGVAGLARARRTPEP